MSHVLQACILYVAASPERFQQVRQALATCVRMRLESKLVVAGALRPDVGS